MDRQIQQATMPWSSTEEFAANLAIGNLRNASMAALKNERGIHAETLMVLVGAVGGQAVAHAAWERIRTGQAQVNDVQTKDGRHFYFGDVINAYLIAETGSVLPFWNLIAATALALGLPQQELPDPREIFRHVTSVLGTEAFGIVRTPPGHQPGIQPQPALQAFWPTARKILSQPGWQAAGRPAPPPSTPPTAPAQGLRGMFGRKQRAQSADSDDMWHARVATQHWPIVVGRTAQLLIEMTKDVLDPAWSLKILMEAAVSMSKIRPDAFPQER